MQFVDFHLRLLVNLEIRHITCKILVQMHLLLTYKAVTLLATANIIYYLIVFALQKHWVLLSQMNVTEMKEL